MSEIRTFVRIVSVEGGHSWEKVTGDTVVDRGGVFDTEADARTAAIEVNGSALVEGAENQTTDATGEVNEIAGGTAPTAGPAAASADVPVLKRYRFIKDYQAGDVAYATGQEVELNEIQGAAFVTDEIAEEITA